MSLLQTVRRVEPGDVGVIAEIYTESILAHDCTMDTEPHSGEDIGELISSLGPREAIFVIQTDQSVRGWGIVKKYSDRPGYTIACETSVYLFRDLLRQGLGRQLQLELLRFARTARYHHVVTKIWADNASSIAFHTACGFSLVGIQSQIGFVDGFFRDIAIMECLLNDREAILAT